LNLKLCFKEYNKIFALHLILAPQLSSGRQHNYSTKTRLVGITKQPNQGWWAVPMSVSSLCIIQYSLMYMSILLTKFMLQATDFKFPTDFCWSKNEWRQNDGISKLEFAQLICN
jgi:hypothetical protein